MSKNVLQTFLDVDVADKQPRVSLYMPTHRSTHTGVDGDRILFKNLVSQVQSQLEANYSKEEAEPILKNLDAIYLDSRDFWLKNKEGLILFAWQDHIQYFRLRQELDPIAIVGDNFHLLPLFAYYIDAQPAILVNISRDRIHFYQVDRYSYEAFEPDHIHTRFNELFDDIDLARELVYSVPAGGKEGAYFHGYQSKSEEMEKDRDKYFRYVHAELEKLSRDVDQKIIISGTSENVGAFKKIASGNAYYDKTINRSVVDLDEASFKLILEDYFSEDTNEELAQIQQNIALAKNDGKLVTDSRQIEEKAQGGQVAHLYVDYQQVSSSNTSLDAAVKALIQQKVDITVLNEGRVILDQPFSAITR